MKTKLPYADALALAQDFIYPLRFTCQRIEIAGSIRRRKPEVGDIEIVCIPKTMAVADLFGAITERSLLEERLRAQGLRALKNGPLFKQFDIGRCTVDLFITTPEKWGVIYAIRTGCAEFSRWLVTRRNARGALPSNMHVADGRLWLGDEAIDTPEEKDFFEAIHLPWMEPEERNQIPVGKLQYVAR